MSNVHVLHPGPSPLAPFLRVGHTGHHKLEALIAANRMPYNRFVFDAAHIAGQTSLVKMLAGQGAEIVLDLNVGETAAPGRWASSTISSLPWANPDRPWAPEDYGARRNADLVRMMAEFAVKYGANAVLAPAFLDEDPGRPWRAPEIDTCIRLRTELDRAGGAAVAVDVQMIATMSDLKDRAAVARRIADLEDLPFHNLWLRISGFGATSTGVSARGYIEAVRKLHEIGRPLVADMSGGFPGVATLAFGGVGGLAHGVAIKETFDANKWRKASKRKGGGGGGARIYIPDLDRFVSSEQADVIFAGRGMKSRLGCRDTSCCPDGIEDMHDNGHAHFLIQRRRQIGDLDGVPEDRRAEHFLLRVLDPAVRASRLAARLKFEDDGVQKLVKGAKTRLTRMRDALGGLNDVDVASGETTVCRPPVFRGRPGSIGGLIGASGRL